MTIGERIYELLRDTERPLTSREIAAELHVRHADVVAALRNDFRFGRWPAPRVSPRKKLYGALETESRPQEQTGAAA